MTLTRRALLQTAAAAAVFALTGCGAGRYRGAERTITIAGGQSGGFYLQVARLLAHEINAVEPGLRCRALATGGSEDNIALIRSGGADIGISQSDVALTAVKGTGSTILAGIGRMYEDYLQLVVRRDSDIDSIGALAGRRVSIGALGSGAAITSKRVLEAAHLDVEDQQDSLSDAAALLEARRIDALLWCGGVPTPTLLELHRRVRIRLLPLDARLLSKYATAYQKVNTPAGGYDQDSVPTVGVANLLLCARSLPDDVVGAITAVIVGHASRLVPREALGTQFLDQRALINLLGVPMHPGAATTYRELHG
jgi:uncharacterized protein